ncbi:GNAT family N-acetyltransferase [Shewanella marina]|uniref:GNAT family N-acetyltransferase n=1 Tax=Shewanella marina TaxID=487319 RepID=UPI0004724698|nr:GNAT family N-acetyltransferase [Shewanella marina]
MDHCIESIRIEVSEQVDMLSQAAALIDHRDDNAHPLDHASFFRSRAVIVALTPDNTVIGCAAIKEGQGDVAEFGYLVVAPAFRRRGIAQRLTEKRTQVAKDLGIKLLFATIRDENQASKANLLKAGWHFWANFLSIRGTGNVVGWYYFALDAATNVDQMMSSLVGDRITVK